MGSDDTDATHCPECALVGHTREHDHHGHGTGHDHGDGHNHGDGHDHGGGHDHGAPVPGGHGEGERFDVQLDLSGALRRLAAEDEEVALKLVAVDGDGNDVTADEFQSDEIELVLD